MVDFVAGRQALLERQTFILISTDLGGGRIADGGQVYLMRTGLLGELLAIAPVLYFPCPANCEQQQRQHADQRQLHRARAHGTSLKKM